MDVIHGDIVERRISAVLAARSREEPVIAMNGPRSVGKSTVLSDFARTAGVEVIDLDDLETREAVRANVNLAVAGPPPLCVDEYQHVPHLLDALKTRMNREGALAGTAVITGSTRHDALPRSAQALTGRLHPMTIWPLSQGEMEGVEENLLIALGHDPDAAVNAHPRSRTTRVEYVDRILAGGFPLAVRRDRSARARWFDDYVRTSVERDAAALAKVRQRHVLAELLRRLSSQTAQLLNLSAHAAALEVDRRTIDQYTRLLEDLFLVVRLPAWGKSLRTRTTVSPKVHVVDSGVAAHLTRINGPKLASLDPSALTAFGHLLETFVVGELRKQISWLDEPLTQGHWRTSDGDEADLVVEFSDGRVVAFEVKANERVSGEDFRGLRKLRDSLGQRFVAGVAFSLGTRSYTYEHRLHAMPVDRIWQPVPTSASA